MERPKWIGLVALCTMLGCGLFSATRMQRVVAAGGAAAGAELLHATRGSKTDLEISWPAVNGSTAVRGFLTYKDLQALPQVTATVEDDETFTALHAPSVQVTGVELGVLAKALRPPASQDIMMARCMDGYVGLYPAEYVAAHHPILVLTVDGLMVSEWASLKKASFDPGPYMVSYAAFAPAWKVLSHEDRPQIPDQVLEIEFRQQKDVFGPIAPRYGEGAAERAGFAIAKQNCLRCHNAGPYGGTKAGWPWEMLTLAARTDPAAFGRYVHDPQAVNAQSKMAGSPQYDAVTLAAITAYFQSLAKQ